MSKNITGNRYGKLVANSKAESRRFPSGQTKEIWNFTCDCGNEKEIFKHSVVNNGTKSCGCINTSRMTKHGMHKHYMYKIYHSMRSRCKNEKDKAYSNYGGRGITVCHRWDISFENFYKDMGERPTKNFSLDRIDNNKGYGPNNCKWSNAYEQNSNQRNSKKYEFLGSMLSVYDLSRFCNLSPSVLRGRIDRGMSVYMAITKPVDMRYSHSKRSNI